MFLYVHATNIYIQIIRKLRVLLTIFTIIITTSSLTVEQQQQKNVPYDFVSNRTYHVDVTDNSSEKKAGMFSPNKIRTNQIDMERFNTALNFTEREIHKKSIPTEESLFKGRNKVDIFSNDKNITNKKIGYFTIGKISQMKYPEHRMNETKIRNREYKKMDSNPTAMDPNIPKDYIHNDFSKLNLMKKIW